MASVAPLHPCKTLAASQVHKGPEAAGIKRVVVFERHLSMQSLLSREAVFIIAPLPVSPHAAARHFLRKHRHGVVPRERLASRWALVIQH
jgi:hypothetical protein